MNLAYPGRKREVKQQIVEMTLNGSGVRDISRGLRVSSATVIQELKKNSFTLVAVNRKVLGQLQPEQVSVEILLVQDAEDCIVEESELDEMWSYVKSKRLPQMVMALEVTTTPGKYWHMYLGREKIKYFSSLKPY